MTKEAQKRKRIRELIDRIKRKYRIVVVSMDTFEERRHYILSPLNIIVISVFIGILVAVLMTILFAYTPLKRIIPGFPSYEEEQIAKAEDLKNIKFLDEIKRKTDVELLYYSNINSILNNNIPADPTLDSVQQLDSSGYNNLDDIISKEDSLLRLKIDEREKYQLLDISNNNGQVDDLKGVFMFPPLNGTISNSMNASEGHYGIDLIAPKDEAVKSILDGTVIYADWTPENGHVIHIQHGRNLISVYKHNSFILKNTGELVEAGDAIAIVGNTGELSTGTHLHFELWYKGIALNPEDYIHF